MTALSVLLLVSLAPVQEGDLEIHFGQSQSVPEIAKPVAVALDRDAKVMAAVASDGSLSVYSLSDQKLLGMAPAHSKGEASVAFSPNGRLVATWGAEGSIKVWSVEPLQSREVVPRAGKPGALAISGDASLLAAAAQNGALTVYGTKDGKPIQEFKAHKGRILAAAFEPAGRTIVTIGEDVKIKSWDVQTGSPAGGEIGFPNRVNTKLSFRSAAATPDGSMFVVGCRVLLNRGGFSDIDEYDQIRVYDRSGRQLLVFDRRLPNSSDRVGISPDGRVVVSTGPSGRLFVWDAESAALPLEIKGVGKCAGMALRQSERSWILAAAGDSAGFWKIASPRPPVPPQTATSAPGGFELQFVTPQEPWPYTNKQSARVVVEARGALGDLRWKLRVVGDNPRDLRVVPSDAVLRTGPRVDENVALKRGPNVIEVTASDGANSATLTKTITYIPDGPFDIATLYGTSRALVIGIDAYSKVRPLEFAVSDADAIATVLREKHGFTDIRVLRNPDATKANIVAALNALTDTNTVRQEDRVVVFYAGHGEGLSVADGSLGYIIPVDFPADFKDPSNHRLFLDRCVSMSYLRDIARASPAKHMLFLLDCCFSGISAETRAAHSAKALGVELAAQSQARVVVTAGSDKQSSWEMAALKHGAFTKYVLDALGSRVADKNGDGLLTSSELYAYVCEALMEKNPPENPQSAQFGRLTSSQGEIVFRVPG